MELLRKGSQGDLVKDIQEYLEVEPTDGIYGSRTEAAVQRWQKLNNLFPDGVVGPKTLDTMGLLSTDNTHQYFITPNGLQVKKHHLPKDEYKEKRTNKEYLFLHHTAGWHNPYNVIDQWGRDSRGCIATEFVVGGPSVKGTNETHDGVVLQAFPEGFYGWHLGKNGNQKMHTNSVGIEVCNFGYLNDKCETYAGTKASGGQIVELPESFRGYKKWHKYSDKQLENLKKLIIYIADRDNIDVTKGLVEEVKQKGAKGFEFNEDAYYGRVKGMWTHTNTRKDKFDMFPQPELIDMLLTL